MDVDVIFLNAKLKEDKYIAPPARYKAVAMGMVLKSNKTLKLYQREWNIALDESLREDLKMIKLKTKKCIYVWFNEDRSEYIILAVYVDDVLDQLKRLKQHSNNRL